MILLLSGPAAAGKTTICELLTKRHGFAAIKSSRYLRTLVKPPKKVITREVLQEIGDQLDLDTDYNWLIADVAVPQMEAQKAQKLWFVDSVRKPQQVERFSRSFPGEILHCHVTAPDDVLKLRLQERDNSNGEASYEKAFEEHIVHPNEASARSLGDIATLVVDTSKSDAASACSAIMREVHNVCHKK